MKTGLKCLLMTTLMATISMMMVGCNKTEDKKATDKEQGLAVANVNDDTEAIPDTDKKKNKEYLVQRVSNIYKDVCDTYNAVQDGFNFSEKLAQKDFDSVYCSDAWNKLVSEVVEYDEKNNADEIGFFDFDYWIMGQDFQDMSFRDVKVPDMHDNKATVSLILVNCGLDIKLKLTMVYERGDWYIDDFENQTMEFEMVKNMKEWIKI